MSAKNIAVCGIYHSREEVEAAVDALRNAGFRFEDISALIPTGAPGAGVTLENSTKSAEGAAAGAASGFLLGGTLGLLASIGTIVFPGVGALIAAGPILSMFAGAGVGGVVGGISGALAGLGIPEYEAKRYEGYLEQGSILVSVHCDDNDWSARAQAVMEETKAESIASAAEAPMGIRGSSEPPPSRAGSTS